MEDQSKTVQSASQAASNTVQTPRTETAVTAQTGGNIFLPQLTGVNVTNGNLTLNNVINTYVQPPVRTKESSDVTPSLKENIQGCQNELKSYLQSITKTLSQGTKEEPSSTPLKNIFTELYITEGGSGEVNREHEVIDLECKRHKSEERKIHLNDIFKPLSDEEEPPQKVLTKGIAGIGKTVAVQKFTQDWADDTANQNFHFIFPFTFRELNLIHDQTWCLLDLIRDNFEEVGDLEKSDYESLSILFIFDGLDESKFPLDFNGNEMCRSVTKTTKVDGILTNLIKGKLLHKASVWITCRPAAISKIDLKYINRVTEVRGFNDKQKEEYFLKIIRDKSMAQIIYDHLHSLRSLYIMCHIPIFCWISAMALQSLKVRGETELPKTLTEMYTHFLIIQTKVTGEKDYQPGDTSKDMIMKLGKLAFEQLEKRNIIFYEKDLADCKIDLKQATVHSGVCTQIIKKEDGLHTQEVYSFIHLTVQEFLAALYVQERFMISRENVLNPESVKVISEQGEIPAIFLHKEAVIKALDSDNGQWDLFLRFLLGLSQDKNQKLLQKLLGLTEKPSLSTRETISYIHGRIKKMSYTDKSINLFHCLNELGDQSLVEQVQAYQKSGDVSNISPSHWSALAFVLLVSSEDLSVFDLKNYYMSDDVLERLLPVLKASKTALLSECKLTERCCQYISAVLSDKSSALEYLDLSKNKLQDSGMKHLSNGLKSDFCKLQKLSLRECDITHEGVRSLAEGLASNSAHLTELDLSKNGFSDKGAELLAKVLNKCDLETLRLSECDITENGCKALVSALRFKPSRLKNLDLSKNSFGSLAVTQLSDFLKHRDCHLQRLWLFRTNLEMEDTAAVASALAENPSHIKELDLGGNRLRDAGVTKLSLLLKDPKCTIDVLRLVGCRFAEEGCVALVSSLKSNPAHLRVLDLGRNDIKDRGAENLSGFLKEPRCRLETLSLRCCSLTTAGFQSLIGALSHSSTLKELDLTFNKLLDQDVKLLCDWLKTPQCSLEILRLSDCSEVGCEALALALMSKPSHLRELELSRSRPGEAGLGLLEDLRKTLQKLTVT